LKSIVFLFVTLACLIGSSISHAYTAIAVVDGAIQESFNSRSGSGTQKLADQGAITGCREAITKAGFPKLAKRCRVAMRAKGPGYGAIVCGVEGCAYNTGYDIKQESLDAAWKNCDQAGYTNCQANDIVNWYDDNFPAARTATNQGGSCRPTTARVQCRSNCVNGNCLVSYENGCKIHVQVQPKFNPFNNAWEFPSPAC